ncbi:MAG: AAA family ATPase, partial [Ktedonobacteraceae bacterium]
MEHTWRISLAKYIEDHYIRKPEEWFDFDLSLSGLLNITIVSAGFKGLSLEERREQIGDMLRQIQAPSSTGFLSLYTPDEATSIHLSRPLSTEENPVYTWLDLAQQAANPSENQQPSKREPHIPRTITFYSFKGGVGRTTALTHVAAILAMRGRKVVAVDLDLEAPGLSSALSLTPSPQYGIVDYFYERAYLPEGVEPNIPVTKIFGEVRIADAPGRVFVVPAGTLSLDYIAKVDDLRANTITENGEDLWSIFYREITEQLQPDVILV